MKKLLLLLLLPVLISCGNDKNSEDKAENQTKADSLETEEEMEFKVLDSKNIVQDSVWGLLKMILPNFLKKNTRS